MRIRLGATMHDVQLDAVLSGGPSTRFGRGATGVQKLLSFKVDTKVTPHKPQTAEHVGPPEGCSVLL